jgi:hypothetical protein
MQQVARTKILILRCVRIFAARCPRLDITVGNICRPPAISLNVLGLVAAIKAVSNGAARNRLDQTNAPNL